MYIKMYFHCAYVSLAQPFSKWGPPWGLKEHQNQKLWQHSTLSQVAVLGKVGIEITLCTWNISVL